MSFKLTVRPSGREFVVDAGETLLDAALRQGVTLPYGCRNGACGSCRARVLDGAVEHGPHADKALSAADEAAGFTLLCCARTSGDLVIEAREVAAGDIQARKLPSRVASLEQVAPDVIVIRLQLPATERLQYLAGQYLEFILRDGTRRSYSMASAPGDSDQVELHVRHMPGGRFTDALFGVTTPAVKVRDILRFEAPLGTFFLREDSDRPMLLLASGTGFAPIKAIVEQCIRQDIRRPMTLYWGGRRPHDLYMNALCEQWQRDLPHFRYVPVVSDALPEDAWQGRTGFVHLAMMADVPDMSGHEVYACGAPIVIASARRDFTQRCGLPDEAFHADAFTSAADQA